MPAAGDAVPCWHLDVDSTSLAGDLGMMWLDLLPPPPDRNAHATQARSDQRLQAVMLHSS
jgi:hypothetical protein